MTNIKVIKTEKVFRIDDEIIIITATTEGCAGKKYVSVTANTIEPITIDDAKERVRNGLEDGELWRMAVQAQKTEDSLQDWIQDILSNDELDGFDNSLYPEKLRIGGFNYIFDSRSCGCLHDSIKEVTGIFDQLITLHIKGDKKSISLAESIINKIPSDNVNELVKKYTKEIIGIGAR